MKKLLALVLIFAMAGIASAAIVDVSVNGEAYTGQDVYASDYIQVALVDADVITFPFPVAVGSTIIVSLGDEASMTFPLAYNMGSSTITPVEDGFSWTGNATWFMGALPGDNVFVLEFHVPDGTPASTEITIDWDLIYSGATIAGGEVLHVVPEPMTIALLGLGGLFLRRRRS